MNMKEISAQIYRNAIQHHRNMMKCLAQWSREQPNMKKVYFPLMKSHAAEIKKILNDWELSYPIKRKSAE